MNQTYSNSTNNALILEYALYKQTQRNYKYEHIICLLNLEIDVEVNTFL